MVSRILSYLQYVAQRIFFSANVDQKRPQTSLGFPRGLAQAYQTTQTM
jgi:hypothetical protein